MFSTRTPGYLGNILIRVYYGCDIYTYSIVVHMTAVSSYLPCTVSKSGGRRDRPSESSERSSGPTAVDHTPYYLLPGTAVRYVLRSTTRDRNVTTIWYSY